MRGLLLRAQRPVRAGADEPCPTFRPDHPDGLRPPEQLRFVFRQERRRQAVFAFPTAQEQAALQPDERRASRSGVTQAPRTVASECLRDHVRITVLGKSPAWQDANGACCGYLVEGGGQIVLLDCGPGVFAKLRAVRRLPAVDAVLITHLHADHILDLVPFASGLRYRPWDGPPPRPRLIAPPGAPEASRRSAPARG